MILSGKEIERNLGKEIFIEPFNPSQLNPNSYNLRLHDELMVYEEEYLDMKRPNKTSPLRLPKEGMILETGKLYLGRTIEHTRTESFVPMLEGRSSVGRLGLFCACYRRIWGRRLFWLLDLRNVLRSTNQNLSWNRNLSNILSLDRGRLRKICWR